MIEVSGFSPVAQVDATVLILGSMPGVSSLEKAIVYAEVRQGNFDLFNWRGGFQGDGQKFRLRVQLGSRSSQALLSFEEPWFLEHRLALGFELFRTQSDYYSAYYDELRTGAEIYLRRRLFELVACCREAGIDPEAALRRFVGKMERGVEERVGAGTG